ncbi:MAG: hypothetical protein R3B99_06725 [Polyangiales bacterium]
MMHARGDLDAADAALDEVRPRDDHERGLLLGMRARLAFSRGDADACLAFYDQSIPLLEGRDSERRADALARAFVLFRRLGRSGEARRALDALRGELGESTIHRSSTSMQLGTLLHSQGRFRESIDALADAERHAARVEDLVVLAGAVEIRADALHRLGRHEEGRAAMATLEPWRARMDPCTRATYVTNLGNQGLIEETPTSLRAALGPLEEGWSLFREECPRPVDAAATAVDLSTTLFRLNRLDEARTWLERATSSTSAIDGARVAARASSRARVARPRLRRRRGHVHRARPPRERLRLAGFGVALGGGPRPHPRSGEPT